jgi:hypothetical protein
MGLDRLASSLGLRATTPDTPWNHGTYIFVGNLLAVPRCHFKSIRSIPALLRSMTMAATMLKIDRIQAGLQSRLSQPCVEGQQMGCRSGERQRKM